MFHKAEFRDESSNCQIIQVDVNFSPVKRSYSRSHYPLHSSPSSYWFARSPSHIPTPSVYPYHIYGSCLPRQMAEYPLVREDDSQRQKHKCFDRKFNLTMTPQMGLDTMTD
jgi:hypothetical protein